MTRVLLALIRIYQRALSPYWPGSCRYLPTCSEYAREAVEGLGPWRGGWLALRRLLRCHPLGGNGFDPVPVPQDAWARDESASPAGGVERHR